MCTKTTPVFIKRAFSFVHCSRGDPTSAWEFHAGGQDLKLRCCGTCQLLWVKKKKKTRAPLEETQRRRTSFNLYKSGPCLISSLRPERFQCRSYSVQRPRAQDVQHYLVNTTVTTSQYGPYCCPRALAGGAHRRNFFQKFWRRASECLAQPATRACLEGDPYLRFNPVSSAVDQDIRGSVVDATPERLVDAGGQQEVTDSHRTILCRQKTLRRARAGSEHGLVLNSLFIRETVTYTLF